MPQRLSSTLRIESACGAGWGSFMDPAAAGSGPAVPFGVEIYTSTWPATARPRPVPSTATCSAGPGRPSDEYRATGHIQSDSADPRRVIRDEEQRGVGDITWCAQ